MRAKRRSYRKPDLLAGMNAKKRFYRKPGLPAGTKAKKQSYQRQDEKLDRALLGMSLVILCLGMTLLVGMITVVFPEWIYPRTFARDTGSLPVRSPILRRQAVVGEEQTGGLLTESGQIQVSAENRSMMLEEVGWAPGDAFAADPPTVAPNGNVLASNALPGVATQTTSQTPPASFVPSSGQPTRQTSVGNGPTCRASPCNALKGGRPANAHGHRSVGASVTVGSGDNL